MNPFVKNEDRQWHEAWKVEALRADRKREGNKRSRKRKHRSA